MVQGAKTLMVQGTTSDAGKTTLVAGFGRLCARRGIRVAPFKPQNMALNSAVTIDGGEIGRSQALQAEACGLQPHSDMNPILLKPNSDTGAQVIVHGHALHNFEAGEYHSYKPRALKAVLESHSRLADTYQLILVEGAGSPAEINLREGDVANMGFAEAADCPVVLVADIDRGGVFAHLVGTLELLSESEQQRVHGFIINRFRGDIALLQSGLDWLEQRTGKPVLAVLPYLHGLNLDAEDGIDVAQEATDTALRIKVPVFPRISNHTDYDALRLHPDVDLEYVGPDDSLAGADLIILPGSKSVHADLDWFINQGFAEQLATHLRYGGKVLGICGGFQMLGAEIDDPLGIEGAAGNRVGLGYFDAHTQLTEEKRLSRVSGSLCLDVSVHGGGGFAGNDCGGNGSDKDSPDKNRLDEAKRFTGYEIHCGRTRGPSLERPLLLIEGRDQLPQADGAISDDGRIAGTYVHGLLDHPEALAVVLRWAGLDSTRAGHSIDRNARREKDLERLADLIEVHTDWSKFSDALGFDLTRDSLS